MTRTLTLAWAVAPPTGRKLTEEGAGGAAIAAIRNKGPIIPVTITD